VATANLRTVGAVNKGASGWSGATASVCLNGAAVAVGAFSPFTVGTGVLAIGAQSASQAIQGSIKNVKFWNTRLIDQQLVSLTS